MLLSGAATSLGAAQMRETMTSSAGQWALWWLIVYFLHSCRQQTADSFNDSQCLFLCLWWSSQMFFCPTVSIFAMNISTGWESLPVSTSLKRQVIITPREATNMYFFYHRKAEYQQRFCKPHLFNYYIICEHHSDCCTQIGHFSVNCKL